MPRKKRPSRVGKRVQVKGYMRHVGRLPKRIASGRFTKGKGRKKASGQGSMF